MTQNLPSVITRNDSVFSNNDSFELGQRMAKALSLSKLIPTNFQGNLSDCIIALELAQRLGASPLAVMQNIFIVHGKPGFSAQFVIAMVNSCGRYSPMRFEVEGEGDDKICHAWAYDLANGDRLDGPPVSIKMAKDEQWFSKNGSKWKTMPDLMLRYRAATFFGRLYAPELMMGMRTVDEIRDTPKEYLSVEMVDDVVEDLNKRFIPAPPPADHNVGNPVTPNLFTKPVPETVPETLQEPETIDNAAYEAEAKKINALKSSEAVDKWRFSNFERLANTYNGPTVAALSDHLADVYSALMRDGEEG